MPIKNNSARFNKTTKRSCKAGKHRRKRNIEPIKVFLVVIPIIMIVVITLGVWITVREHNKSIEAGNIKPNDFDADSVQMVLSEQDYKKALTVVSPNQKLPEDYNVDLEKYNGIFCDKLIIEPLKKMLSDAKQQGINLTLTKGYVTVEEQDKLYNNKVKELMSSEGLTIVKAEAEAKKTVPPGNYSESQTGLSVGISTSKDISNADFIQTDAYKWLSNNCINYGFIIRYPESKEKETGMEFDPTYYRFVGVDAAKKMRVLDMCLDEYYNYINSR